LFTAPHLHIDRLEVIHTPGHSHGSVCILDRETKALFTGDTLAGNARGSLRNSYLPDLHDQDGGARLRSVESLVALDFDSILPFHHHPIIGNARQLLEKAILNKSASAS
jgi:glyoxylase-like metal-dependent hydrolase (beta-lactamase superfamily II)